jgi:hypothetical protein
MSLSRAAGIVPLALLKAEVVNSDRVVIPIETMLSCVFVDVMKLVDVVYDWLSAKSVGARTGVTIKMSKIEKSRK